MSNSLKFVAVLSIACLVGCSDSDTASTPGSGDSMMQGEGSMQAEGMMAGDEMMAGEGMMEDKEMMQDEKMAGQ